MLVSAVEPGSPNWEILSQDKNFMSALKKIKIEFDRKYQMIIR
jgi:hypothetical protein